VGHARGWSYKSCRQQRAFWGPNGASQFWHSIVAPTANTQEAGATCCSRTRSCPDGVQLSERSPLATQALATASPTHRSEHVQASAHPYMPCGLHSYDVLSIEKREQLANKPGVPRPRREYPRTAARMRANTFDTGRRRTSSHGYKCRHRSDCPKPAEPSSVWHLMAGQVRATASGEAEVRWGGHSSMCRPLGSHAASTDPRPGGVPAPGRCGPGSRGAGTCGRRGPASSLPPSGPA
jgi:hypothetical protein